MRGIAAAGPMLAQPVLSRQSRNPAARIALLPIPSNRASASNFRIASASKTAIDSPDGSPVAKKYLTWSSTSRRCFAQRTCNSLLQHAAFGGCLQKVDNLAARAGRHLVLHLLDRLRNVELGIVKNLVAALDLVAFIP